MLILQFNSVLPAFDFPSGRKECIVGHNISPYMEQNQLDRRQLFSFLFLRTFGKLKNRDIFLRGYFKKVKLQACLFYLFKSTHGKKCRSFSVCLFRKREMIDLPSFLCYQFCISYGEIFIFISHCHLISSPITCGYIGAIASYGTEGSKISTDGSKIPTSEAK